MKENDMLAVLIIGGGILLWTLFISLEFVHKKLLQFSYTWWKPVVYIDIDDTIAANSASVQDFLRPHMDIDYVNRATFELSGDDSHKINKVMRDAFATPGFFEYAIKKILELESRGCEVRLLTSSVETSQKIKWVRKYLGEKWTRRVFICNEKWRLDGDILIDDREQPITGHWTHIYFTQPWNKNCMGPHLGSWKNVDMVMSAIDNHRTLWVGQRLLPVIFGLMIFCWSKMQNK
jgi:5'(3')-deoxyribonucleotidase